MKNLVGVWPNLFRALEIAKVGNHSVSLYAGEEYQNANEDYKMIKAFCAGWFDNWSVNGDIKIELNPVNYSKIKESKRCETLEDIQKRIDNCKNHIVVNTGLCSSSEALLKSAYERCYFSINQVEIVQYVAETIAKCELSKDIKPYHIAESIMYQNIDFNTVTCLGNNTKKFGKCITIKGIPQLSDIEEAIQYLSKIIEK